MSCIFHYFMINILNTVGSRIKVAEKQVIASTLADCCNGQQNLWRNIQTSFAANNDNYQSFGSNTISTVIEEFARATIILTPINQTEFILINQTAASEFNNSMNRKQKMQLVFDNIYYWLYSKIYCIITEIIVFIVFHHTQICYFPEQKKQNC